MNTRKFAIFIMIAGMSDILIRSNVKWSLKVNEWFTCTPQSGYNDGWMLVTWPENTTPREIYGIITITGEGGVSEVVTYTQDSYVPPYVPCPPCCSD